jgi:hypothetical protein
MASPVSDPVVPSSRPQPSPSLHDGSGSHRRSVIIGVLTLVVLIAAVVGAAFALKSDGTERPERVLMVGDSITDQSRSGFIGALPSDDSVDIEAVPGRRFAEMLPFATRAAQSRPDEVVVNLGSNDVLLGETDASTNQAMDSMFGLFTTTPCVTLVTVNEHFVFGSDQAAHARRINDRLRTAATRWGWSIVDWNKMVEDYEAAGSPKGKITFDSVHPSDVGKPMLVDAVRDSLSRCHTTGAVRST